MPILSSVIRSNARLVLSSRTVLSSTCTRPPPGLYLMALESRLSTTRAMRFVSRVPTDHPVHPLRLTRHHLQDVFALIVLLAFEDRDSHQQGIERSLEIVRDQRHRLVAGARRLPGLIQRCLQLRLCWLLLGDHGPALHHVLDRSSKAVGRQPGFADIVLGAGPEHRSAGLRGVVTGDAKKTWPVERTTRSTL